MRRILKRAIKKALSIEFISITDTLRSIDKALFVITLLCVCV